MRNSQSPATNGDDTEPRSRASAAQPAMATSDESQRDTDAQPRLSESTAVARLSVVSAPRVQVTLSVRGGVCDRRA